MYAGLVCTDKWGNMTFKDVYSLYSLPKCLGEDVFFSKEFSMDKRMNRMQFFRWRAKLRRSLLVKQPWAVVQLIWDPVLNKVGLNLSVSKHFFKGVFFKFSWGFFFLFWKYDSVRIYQLLKMKYVFSINQINES